jgi:hypothetical protein
MATIGHWWQRSVIKGNDRSLVATIGLVAKIGRWCQQSGIDGNDRSLVAMIGHKWQYSDIYGNSRSLVAKIDQSEESTRQLANQSLEKWGQRSVISDSSQSMVATIGL